MARLAASRVNAHSAARGANFTPIELAGLLSRVGVGKVDEGGAF